MSAKLTKGCVVFMKASSGLTGYGNGQCVSEVCEPLGTVSLYGHNEHYKIYDIDRIVEYPITASALAAKDERIEELKRVLLNHRWDLHGRSKRPCQTCRESAEVLGLDVPDQCARIDYDKQALTKGE